MTPMPPAIKKLFADAYKYREKYLEPENTNDFWLMAATEMQTLCHQHNNTDFAQHMLMACYADIERELLDRRAAGIASAQTDYEYRGLS